MASKMNMPISPKDSGPGSSAEPDFEKVIQEAIYHDPIIEDSDKVSVSFKDKGFSKREIHLIGKVGSEKQKQRAQELAEINSKDKVTVVNEIIVA